MFQSNGLMQVAVLMVAGSALAANTARAQTSTQDQPERSTWGALDATGSGFLIGRTEFGEMRLSGYAVIRYINQLPATQTFVDHLGNVNVIDPRNDIQFHRAMLHFRGWLFSPKIRYQITVWSVLSTNQTTLYGSAGYQFHQKFNAYAGINTIGGSRSVMGSHPFWLANDRVLADEFFRPGFTGTAWVNGELAPGFWYHVAAGNSLSQLGFTAKQLTRDIATGQSLWWMPTTKEFGPNGSFDDWEHHEKLATRFGVSAYRSRENRFNQNANPAADNYQVYGDSHAGFRNSHEYLQGLNYYPVNTRNVRFSTQVIEVDRSAQSSPFGFYVGGQRGTTLSSAFSFYF